MGASFPLGKALEQLWVFMFLEGRENETKYYLSPMVIIKIYWVFYNESLPPMCFFPTWFSCWRTQKQAKESRCYS